MICEFYRTITIVYLYNDCFWFVGLSRKGVLEQFETSLQSLQMSSVHSFYLHWPDHEIPIEETLLAVQELYDSKKAGLHM